MNQQAWDAAWFDGGIVKQSMRAWRGVEAQHVVSTMRLVDTADEQAMLEQLIEGSKPAPPATRSARHYLLFTPFRYRPVHGSRFRAAGTRGLWYGAEKLMAACAEVAYWRQRFVLDSAGLAQAELLTEHTFFEARVSGTAINLMAPPWIAARAAWTHDSDYSATQAVAQAAREKSVQWICYESVRAPGHRCAAVLDADALEMVAHGTTQQTWHCKATRRGVMMAHGEDRYEWRFTAPAA